SSLIFFRFSGTGDMISSLTDFLIDDLILLPLEKLRPLSSSISASDGRTMIAPCSKTAYFRSPSSHTFTHIFPEGEQTDRVSALLARQERDKKTSQRIY